MHMGACAQVRFGMRYSTAPACSPFYKSAWTNSPCKADLQRLRAVGEGAAYQRSGMPAALAEVWQAVSSVPSAVLTRNNACMYSRVDSHGNEERQIAHISVCVGPPRHIWSLLLHLATCIMVHRNPQARDEHGQGFERLLNDSDCKT